MTIASFEDLCGGICDLAGSPVPDLTRDDDGRLAVALPMDGVEITLTHEPARSVTHFFVLAALDALPQGDELAACRALMDTNAALLLRPGTGLCRHPQTGALLLQRVHALDDGTPVDVYGRMRELAEGIRGWQQTGLAPSGASQADAVSLPGGD
jgi:hypothetical protein